MDAPRGYVISCEHAGNWVPPRFAGLFDKRPGLLHCHRGYDIGALRFARQLAAQLGTTCIEQSMTRLLVDCNRSSDSPSLFSEVSVNLPDEDKHALLQIYGAHRMRVRQAVQRTLIDVGYVRHIAVHSFTPRLDGVLRDADVGLLYDPARVEEERLCRSWQACLSSRMPSLRVRHNYPYLGTDDGLVVSFREQFSAGEAYVGIELELNQRLLERYQGRPELVRRVGEALLCAERQPSAA